MTTETKQLKFDKDEISRFSNGRGEPEWMHTLRLEALSAAEELEMPKPEKTRIKGWNFTDFQYNVNSEKLNSLDELPENVRTLIGRNEEAGNTLVHRNSTLAYSELSEELSEKGVIFTDIETALREHGDLVKKYFMQAVDVRENRLTALHAALLNSGTFLYVPKNVELKVPLQTVYWKDNHEAGLINHVLIVAEDHSSVTYVENYLSEDEDHSSVANIVAEVYAGQNARIAYGAVDNFSKGVTTYVNRRGHAARDGRIEWALGQMNDGNTLSDNTTNLVGDGSFTDTKSVSVGRGDQSQNFVTRVTHFGKGSEGYILTHGVMKDKAKSIFNGISKVEHGAAMASSEQTERVLMLSEGARGDANPILLIDENDVEEAGHAASVGRIDPVQMYYLMSRGVTRKEAQRLIIHGFLAPVVDQLPIEGVKKQLVEVIERKMK
ncbi:MAG TPA: Fe-S cluster assembly protein SufD [Bacillales bacterium]|jgi:Fe-S cluster assembly protein SufD|nr:Fe-S cluster assembly protein SufD [Bacillales bacterium]